jgi:hypothetical protein
VIYVELLVSRAPIAEEIKIFEQEQKSKELGKELEVALNFLKKIATFIAKPIPQVIVILDSKEEVEVGPQSIVEEQLQSVSTLRLVGEEEL